MNRFLKHIVLALMPTLCVHAQTLRYDRPADYFEESLVIGNGMMGASIYGGTNVDRLSLNDITL